MGRYAEERIGHGVLVGGLSFIPPVSSDHFDAGFLLLVDEASRTFDCHPIQFNE